jgi:RNA polymerase sigma factor (sigma-70 family)
MASGREPPVLRFIRRLKAQIRAGGTSDGQLLARFVVQHDEAAFGALVRRHGPMVLAVCRRILGDPNDADDAFQATFLVLVRKAGSLGQPELLANWLYGVASRMALKVRAATAKRRQRERGLTDLPASEAAQELVWRDLRPVLDEELNRLPERYRVPMVLCYLEGHTHQQAARLLGCSRETITTRLARARKKLGQRLARRGLALSATGLAGALAEAASAAAVPAALTNSTLKAALLVAAGRAAITAGVSASVAALLEGTLRTMLVTKLKMVAALVLTLGVLGTGATALTYRSQATEPVETKQEDSPKATTNLGEQRTDRARIPSQRDGVLMMIGTEIKPGEEVPPERIITVQNRKLVNTPVTRIIEISGGNDGRNILFKDKDGEVRAEKLRRDFGKGLPELETLEIESGAGGRTLLKLREAGDASRARYRRLRIGELIEEGQLLGLLDNEVARLEVEIKRSKLAASEAELSATEKTRDEAQVRYHTQVKLRIQNRLNTSDEEVRAAKLAWDKYVYEVKVKKEAKEVAELELRQTRALLETHEIRSRVRGVLRAIYKHPGEAVKALEPVFLIQVAREQE